MVPTRQKTRLTIIQGGAHHGGEGNLPYEAGLQNESDVIDAELIPVDPIPSRSEHLAARARALGLRATPREAKIEQVIQADFPALTVFLLNMDSPNSHARAIRMLADTDRPVMGSVHALSPDGQLVSIRYVAGGPEHVEKDDVAGFFEGLARFTARGGRDRVFGEKGRPEHKPMEQVRRHWNGTFVQENLAKLAFDLPSNNHYLELTRDGYRTLPVIVRREQGDWLAPHALATEVLGNSPAPILRGDDFVVAELRPDGMRLHFARLGRTDSRIRVRGYAGFDTETLDAVERADQARREREINAALLRADRARQAREVEAALKEAERSTISPRRKFFVTD